MQVTSKTTGKEIINFCIYHPEIKRTKIMNEKLFFLFQTFDFFQNLLRKEKYGNLMVWNIISHLTFKKYEKGQIIWNENDIITNMYIIIEGKVKIYKSLKKNNKEIEKEKETGKLISDELFSNLKNMFNPIKRVNSTNNSNEYYYKNTGNELGLDQLKNKIPKRLYKVEAISKCILGELSKTDYTLIFERTDVLEKTSILYFLENLNILQKFIGTYFFENFLSMTTLNKYNYGDIVIHKGNPFKTFYIIRSGSFSLSLYTNKKSISLLDLTLMKNDIKKRFTTQRNFELKESHLEETEYKLFNLGPGEIFGDMEFNFGLQHYIFDVKCVVDNSEVFEINMKTFLKEAPNNFLKQFKNESDKQLDLIIERIKEIKMFKMKSMFKTRNKYFDAFINQIPKTYNKCIIEHNKDPYINCYAKPIKNKLHVKQLKMKNLRLNLENIHFQSKRKRNISYSPLRDYNLTNEKKYSTPQVKFVNRNFNFSSDSSISTNSSKNKLKLNSSRLLMKSKSNLRIDKDKQIISPSIVSPRILINIKSESNLIIPKNLNKETITFRRIISENNKDKFPKCIEINKQFYMKHNSKIIQKKIQEMLKTIK